ncbi:MAG: four-carbon acid sugar kinase family protein [Desulfobaccales bacterium]
MIQLAVIADDLTGAADTAIQFRRVSAPLLLVSHGRLSALGLEDSGASLAVYTDSRHLSPADAAARVRQAGLSVKKLAPVLVYKKIDSCLRGNVGAEVEALLGVLGSPCAFIAPAHPDQGRATLHDIHYVRGHPLAASEVARDPVNPIRDSRLSRLIALQSRYPVGRIDVTEFEGGLARLQEATDNQLRQGRRLIVFDAASQQHLDLIAGLARDHFPGALLAGSAGLARALAQLLPAPNEPLPPGRNLGGQRVLFVCGSGSGVLVEQVAALVQQAGVPRQVLNPGLPAGGRDGLAGVGGDWSAGAVILQLAPVAVTGSQVSRVSTELACRALAAAASEAIRRHRPDVLFLCGGDTAAQVLDAVGATGVWLQSEILPGVVLGKIRGGDCDGLAVVTKPGAFGEGDTLLRLYAILTQ